MKIVLPAFSYRYMYLGEMIINEESNELLITRKYTVSFRYNGNEIHVPINPLATYGVWFDTDALKDLGSKLIERNYIDKNNGIPLLFLFNPSQDYDFMAGIQIPVNENGAEKIGHGETKKGSFEANNRKRENFQFITGYFYGEDNVRRGRSKPIYLLLVVDENIVNYLKKIQKFTIKIENTRVKSNIKYIEGRQTGVRLWKIRQERLNVYLRSFPLFKEPNYETTLTYGDIENIYLGSQLSGMASVINPITAYYSYYYIFPLIITYPFTTKKKGSESYLSLPKDAILNSAIFQINFNNIVNPNDDDKSWKNIESLVDWLFTNHVEGLIKVFFNYELLKNIIDILAHRYSKLKSKDIVDELKRGIYGVEIQTKINLYGDYLLLYDSPSLTKILKIYHKLATGRRSFGKLVIDLLNTLLNDKRLDIEALSNDIERYIKRAVGVYTLTYSLHGASHLIMKALSVLSGINDFGERIITGVSSNYEDVIPHGEILENTFQFENNGFDARIIIFSKTPYTYSLFKNILLKDGNLDIDKIKGILKVIIERDGRESCEVNWELEKSLLKSTISLLYNDNVFKSSKEFLETYSAQRVPAPRDIYRQLYDRFIVKDIIDSLNVGESDKRHVRKKLHDYAQYIIPYYVPQCVDGCYNCVLTERSIRARMCDMIPLQQELKTSKWGALCLLKSKGWLDVNWIDCGLST